MNRSHQHISPGFRSRHLHLGITPLHPLRHWLTHLQIKNPLFAHRIVRLIPAQCPFERDIVLFGQTIVHIPPLCKLNPLYEELVELRFKALCTWQMIAEKTSLYTFNRPFSSPDSAISGEEIW